MITTYKDMHKYSNLNYPSLIHVPNEHNWTIDAYNIVLAWKNTQISHATWRNT